MRFLVLFSLLWVLNVRAQNTEEKLAAQFFAEKEFAKAADIYEELASQQPESIYYYDNLLQCYIQLKDFKSAEKLVEKRIRKFPEIYGYQVDKAYLYQVEELNDKKEEVLKSLLKIKITSPDQADLLSNALMKRRFYEKAVEVYLMARKSLKNDDLFAYSLSELYFYHLKFNEGTEELVKIVAGNQFMVEEVKNRLSLSYTKPDDYKVLTGILLLRLQKQPDNLAYNELLVWSFIQRKDWNGALIQLKAVDKRLKEDGKRLIQLAQELLINEEYEFAMNSYDYVKSLGADKRYFYQAQQGILKCGLLQVKAHNGASLEQLSSLEKEYLDFLNTNGVNWQTAEQVNDLSVIYIYYLHQPDKAITQLKHIIAVPGVNAKVLAECKLNLGDAQLIIGESWEADLLYKQVEKAFNNDALGQEAKFRYARLCYFRAEFEWSQTQLDVLKEATTQLISNNAMKLWLLIQDNTGLDSSEEALTLYAKADLLIFQNKLDEAVKVLDEIPIRFPGHVLTDEIYYSKALIAERQKRYADAEVFYLKVVRDFSFDILADNALINLAKMYEYKMNDTAKAKKIYEMIILNYTGSLFVNEARKRYRFLRGDMMKEGDL